MLVHASLYCQNATPVKFVAWIGNKAFAKGGLAWVPARAATYATDPAATLLWSQSHVRLPNASLESLVPSSQSVPHPFHPALYLDRPKASLVHKLCQSSAGAKFNRIPFLCVCYR